MTYDYRNGMCAVFYSSGNTFVGHYVRNCLQGSGCVFRWKSGLIYSGDLVQNMRVGNSKLIFLDGDEFVCDNWIQEDDVDESSLQKGKCCHVLTL
jgi:hypothetical protein